MQVSIEQVLTAQRDILADGIQELTSELVELQTKKRMIEGELFGLTVWKLDVEIEANSLAFIYVNGDASIGICAPFTIQEAEYGTFKVELSGDAWVAPMGKHGAQFRDYVLFAAKGEVQEKIAEAYRKKLGMGGPVC